MVRLSTFIYLIGCIYLSHYAVEATIFPCNRTFSCGCSRFSANINARIVGGEVAASHSWGWAVSLRNSFGDSICGASILSPNYVVTAAHCVENRIPSLFSIAVGIDTINSGEGQTLSLSSINIHPKYDSITKENDIAILSLRSPINFNNANIAKICLPNVRKGEQSRYPEVDSPIVAIGWGRISSGGSPSNALRQVTVKTVDNKDRTCKVSIKNTDLQFCAAIHGGGKDTCQGDSGGPIMRYSELQKVWVLTGITSYGVGCALPNYAGVYTRVSKYIDWIGSIVGNDGLVTISQNNANIGSMSNVILFSLISFLIVIRLYN